MEEEPQKKEEEFKSVDNQDAWDNDDFDLPEIDEKDQDIDINTNQEDTYSKFYNSQYPGH